jgi:hypothetical protein
MQHAWKIYQTNDKMFSLLFGSLQYCSIEMRNAQKDVVANFVYCSGICLEELHNIHENKARKARLQRTCLVSITGSVWGITINSISRSIMTSSSNGTLRHTHTEIYIYI